jgi:single-strand DNA-binding protein
MNTITLIGRAGRDPEARYLDGGNVVANLTLAVNRRKGEEPDWFNLEIWGKTAQVAVDYVRKGSLIGIIGSVRIDKWADKTTGEPKSKIVVRVDRLELLGSKRDGEGQQASPQPRAATPTAPPVWDGGSAGGNDIPF